MYDRARILAAGEGALVVEFSDRVEPLANEAVRELDRLFRGAAAGAGMGGAAGAWLLDTVPTCRSLLVIFDPLRQPGEQLAARLDDLAGRAMRAASAAVASASTARGRQVAIPVCYDADLAPDLAEAAELTGLSREQVIALHTGGEYLVYMIGFQIGYPYMASLPPALRLPRLQRPRLRTPQGAVAIAGELAGIYSLPSPGGWRVLGTTPWPMYDLGWDPPTLLRAGDRVRFVAVCREEYEKLCADPAIPAGVVSPAEAGREAWPPPAQKALRVVSPGILATVQDLGRQGYGQYGVGPGGAMDKFALRVGNRLLGNPEGAAAVEVTGGGAVFEFLSETVFTWTGAAGPLELDGQPAPAWTLLSARRGQRLSAGPPERGLRGYLCLAGGVAARPVLGSRSTNLAASFGGPFGRACRAGDELEAYVSEPGSRKERACADVVEAVYRSPAGVRGPWRLRLVPGLQADMFGPAGMGALFGGEYVVGADSNRMGYRLAGPRVESRAGHDIISDGLVEGAVQVPGNGQPVLLMADHQTTGGYPKPGVVAAADIPLAAQLAPGARLRFVECDVAAARAARLELEHAVSAAGGKLLDLNVTVDGTCYSIQVDVDLPR